MNQSVSGTNSKKAVNGEISFDDLSFISNPGDVNVEFSIKSSALDHEVLSLQYGNFYNQTNIVASFRNCQPGEIQRGNV